MLFIVFGKPGVGKNFVGRILRDHFGFYFYDADDYLTPEMISAIEQREVFTQNMRDHYFAIVADKITELQKQQQNIVVAQALAKEINRQHLANLFPEAKFILINADDALVDERLINRNDWVNLEYVAKIRQIFEPAQLTHLELDNNYGDAEIIEQLNAMLPIILNK